MKQILAFHNKPELKQEILQRATAHVEADELIRREGYDKSTNKGGFIGCTINEYDHKKWSDILGIDIWVGSLAGRILKNQTENISEFFLDFLNAIKVGTTVPQTNMIRAKFLHFILTEILPKKQSKEVTKIISLFQKSISGVTITNYQWNTAYSAIAYSNVDANTLSVIANSISAVSDYSNVDANDVCTVDVPTHTLIAKTAMANAVTFAANARQASFKKMANKLVELFKSA